MGQASSKVNPLLDESVQNSTMNTLMEELKILQQETLAWRKPKAGEACSHMHVECWDGKFMCSGCSPPQEIIDRDQIKTEQEIRQKLGDEDPSTPEHSVERGVTIAFLVALCKTFNLYNVTTGDVLRDFIIPLTSRSRCRFVELEAMQTAGVVGRAVTFISHCNKAFFGALVAGLCDGGADLNRRVWVDIFTVRQWPSSKSDLHFEVVIRQCPAFMVVCPSIDEVREMSGEDIFSRRFPAAAKARVPFFRIWCLYEIFYAAIEGKPIVMKGGSCRLEEGPEGNQTIYFSPDYYMLEKMYLAVDVEKADATVASDKAMIFKKILSYEEGVEGFNGKVRGVINGATACVMHPGLLCAVCGDAAAMTIVREGSALFFSIAAAGGFQAVLEDLLCQDPDLIHTRGSEALLLAAKGGHLTCLQWLSEKGVDFNVEDREGSTALTFAAQGGHPTCLQWLLEKGADVNAEDRDGRTALQLAALGGHLSCLRLLTEKGVDNTAAKNATALMYSAAGGHLSCLQLLVERGASVNAMNPNGMTALESATMYGHIACKEYLVSKGATLSDGC